MLETISLWLHNTAIGKFLITMLISMTPVAELRIGIPAGVAMGLPVPLALIAGILGNMLPVPIVILFIRDVFKWVRRCIPRFGAVADRIEERAYDKIESRGINRWKVWGLLLFVAIPLPGTGAWTGALIAALMDMRLKNALPAIFLGVLIAGTIMTVLSFGVSQLF